MQARVYGVGCGVKGTHWMPGHSACPQALASSWGKEMGSTWRRGRAPLPSLALLNRAVKVLLERARRQELKRGVSTRDEAQQGP